MDHQNIQEENLELSQKKYSSASQINKVFLAKKQNSQKKGSRGILTNSKSKK